MKVFISWSGTLSHQVAECLKTLIEDVLQVAEPWLSSEDISKGSIWFNEIGDALKDTHFGILCLTQDNVNAPWVLFEAGALSKGLSKNRVCPLLINLTPSDIKPPLSQFNCSLVQKDDILKLLKTINSSETDGQLREEKLNKTFEKFWPEFETTFDAFVTSHKPDKTIPKRSTHEVVEEILEITRSLQNKKQESSLTLTPYHTQPFIAPGISAALPLNDFLLKNNPFLTTSELVSDVISQNLGFYLNSIRINEYFIKNNITFAEEDDKWIYLRNMAFKKGTTPPNKPPPKPLDELTRPELVAYLVDFLK